MVLGNGMGFRLEDLVLGGKVVSNDGVSTKADSLKDKR